MDLQRLGEAQCPSIARTSRDSLFHESPCGNHAASERPPQSKRVGWAAGKSLTQKRGRHRPPPFSDRAAGCQAGLPVVLNVKVCVLGFFSTLLFTTPPGLVVTVTRCGLAPPLTWASSLWLRVRMFFSSVLRAEERAERGQNSFRPRSATVAFPLLHRGAVRRQRLSLRFGPNVPDGLKAEAPSTETINFL
jgi:hypothetical protein